MQKEEMKGTHSVCDFKKMLWMEMEKEKKVSGADPVKMIHLACF